jgi:hypothetical protein
VRRLYYIADDLATTQALSEALHEEGVSDWNFHVVAKDERGLYQHRIHSATPIQRRDVIHTGERWGLAGLPFGLLAGAADFSAGFSGWTVQGWMVLLWGCTAALAGCWLGGIVGLARENYRLAPYREEIEAGRLLIMVDVKKGSRHRVRQIMNMGFPRVRYCGKDSTFTNPFAHSH